MYKGIAQNDIGNNTDVISNTPKSIGINILIRSMAPQILICDEIGSLEDINAIRRATLSGIKGIFTAHSGSIEELFKNENLKKIIESKLIEKVILLDPKNRGNFTIWNENHNYNEKIIL